MTAEVALKRCVDVTQLDLKQREVTEFYDKWAKEYDKVRGKSIFSSKGRGTLTSRLADLKNRLRVKKV